MSFRIIRGDKPDAVFRPNIGQIFLALFIILGMALFGYFSFASHAAQREVREDLYAQETDASALSFTQRDAFNVVYAITEWGYGLRTPREVQVARALLQQRLRVVTSSGELTYDIAPAPFQETLRQLDDIIVRLNDVPPEDRMAFIRQADPILESFLTQNRLLSQAFQERSRAVIEDAVEGRNRAEIQLITTFGSVAIILLVLISWLTFDINRGYRRAKMKIHHQQVELTKTIAHLDRTQRVDELASRMVKQAGEGDGIDQLFRDIGPAFSEVLPGVRIDIELTGSNRGVPTIAASADSPVGVEELHSCTVRIHGIVNAALTREAMDSRMDFERSHDPLTGLPNRSILTQEVQHALDVCTRDGGVAAIYLIDIDRFRDFNNSLGNAGGDAIIIAVAQQLKRELNGTEIAARLSGDEYAVVARFDSHDEARARARQIFESLHFTTLTAATEADISVSMGIAIAAANEYESSELQRSAAMAIYLAQENDRSGFIVFDKSEHATLSDRLSDELAVRNALRNAEFVLYYQPIMKLSSGHPSGAEALIRWNRPGVGIVSPDDFLETARRAGILGELGEEVIDKALAFWSRGMVKAFNISQSGLPYISINVDPIQLEDPLFAQFVIGAARRHSVPLPAIVLEVTEHVLSESSTVVDQLDTLRRLGIRIALDDFGTGYSALGQARNLPLDILKIDRSFIPVDDLEGRERRLVMDIQGIATTLDLVTTVEGVESEVVATALRELGIQYAQGFHYSKPLPEVEFLQWMQQWHSSFMGVAAFTPHDSGQERIGSL